MPADPTTANPFDPASIDPDTAAFNAQLEQLLAGLPQVHTVPAQVTRAARESGNGPFGPIVRSKLAQSRTLAGVPCRVIVPKTVHGIYIHIHGGSWSLMGAHYSDLANERIALAAGVTVISIDYRLAPEHPHPAGPDDCEAVVAWVVRQAQAEFGTDRIVIGGESAGGQLAAVTLLRLRDRHGYRGFRGANLVYGCFDLSMTPSQLRWGDRNLVLSGDSIRWSFDNFVPDPAMRRDPDVSPLYADLTDMPPALFTVGTLDPLLDDSLFMQARWLAAGNQAELAIYPGGVHGFTLFPLALGRRADARCDAFIAQAVAE